MWKKIKKLHLTEEYYKKQVKYLDPNKKMISAFVSFEYAAQRDQVYDEFHSSTFSRIMHYCCKCFYKTDKRILDGKFLKVENAPTPDNIIWKNMDYSNL